MCFGRIDNLLALGIRRELLARRRGEGILWAGRRGGGVLRDDTNGDIIASPSHGDYISVVGSA